MREGGLPGRVAISCFKGAHCNVVKMDSKHTHENKQHLRSTLLVFVVGVALNEKRVSNIYLPTTLWDRLPTETDEVTENRSDIRGRAIWD